MNEKIICQSCGMPMKRDEDFGTDAEGFRSEEYCCFCYQKGEFTDNGITLQEKINKLVKISVLQLGMSEEQARKMAEEKLPVLKRWRENNG